MTVLSRIELYRDRERLWRFRAIALDRETIAVVSEPYEKRSDCVDEASRLWPDMEVSETDE